ncbi:hypothetical protein A0J61_01590 [Choanephora cucurbitarum]|uniref:Uncharacterized protein n=1 Tax=Choanephora cucurbitarum TaxID=101091 RepID=A0A1C7NMI5_9FUNG|nr:hypothetical protein A0J61_01590 [Choanephora cucurbitarum]
MYELIDEKDFLKDGDAKSQIKSFIQEKGELMETADKEDKEYAKQKKLEKKIKRKERERAAMRDEEDGSMDEDEAMSGSESESESEEEDRKRKWFEDSESEEEDSSNKKRVIDIEEPQTLEDQEALALKLLGA